MVKQNCKQNCGPLPCNLVCYVTEQFGETDFCFVDKRLGRHKKGILSVKNQVICCLQATTGEKSKWVAAHTDRWRKGGPKKKSGVDMAVIKQAVETTYITLTQSSGNAVQWCCCFSRVSHMDHIAVWRLTLNSSCSLFSVVLGWFVAVSSASISKRNEAVADLGFWLSIMWQKWSLFQKCFSSFS